MAEEKKETNRVEEPDLAGTYTAADYMQWKLDELVELIRGKVFKMAAALGSNHQRVSRELIRILANHFHNNSCELFEAPFDVFLVKDGEALSQAENVVEPDLCVICDKQKIQDKGCVGVPDLIIEILSPSTSKKDLKWKFDLYEEFGVREYWIVSPYARSVWVNVLEAGKYRTKRPVTEEDKLTSEIFPDLKVDLEEVFRDVRIE